MKIVCSKKELLDNLANIKGGIGTKTTLPVLNNFLLETTTTKLRFVSTDFEITAKSLSSKDVKIAEEGAITIPAKKFLEIVRQLPDEDVSIDVDEKNSIKIKCKKVLYKMMGLPASEYPKTNPSKKVISEIKISQKIFKDMINKSSFAVSTESTRVVLTGVLLKLKDKEIIMVGTDGHRMALVKSPIEKATDVQVIVPCKILNEIQNILGDEGDIDISVCENQIEFSFKDVVINSRVIDGNFPEYESILNKVLDKTVLVDTKKLGVAVSRVALMSATGTSAITLRIKPGQMFLNSSAADTGEGQEEVEIDYKGTEMSVAFNSQYISAAISAVGSDSVELNVKDVSSPGIIKIPGQDSFCCVIMPIRI